MGEQSIYILLACMASVVAMGQGYFPPGSLSAVSKMDSLKVEWYSQELAVLHDYPRGKAPLSAAPLKRTDLHGS